MPHRSSEVVQALEHEILDGRLVPGERLPSEEKLCERFHASRTVIREAIQQLRGR
jgi:GntR family transcriptional repressor for pyruvate dehydrogenase complex